MMRPQRTSGAKAFGVFLCLLGGAAFACPAPESLERETAQLQHVHDGDSLRLADGRRIRLIGLNAPEVAWDGVPAEPLAYEARDLLRSLVSDGDAIQLVYDSERKDHYGRTLAHVYTGEGISLEALLLRRGLAFHIAIPPNTTLADCLAERELEAREAAIGLWGEDVWPAKSVAEMGNADTGYQRLQGRVTDVSVAGGSLWLELDGPLVLRIAEADLAHFPSGFKARAKADWVGRELEVRGWVIDRSDSRAARRGFKPLMMPMRTPHGMNTLSD